MPTPKLSFPKGDVVDIAYPRATQESGNGLECYLSRFAISDGIIAAESANVDSSKMIIMS